MTNKIIVFLIYFSVNLHNCITQDIFVSNLNSQCMRCLCFGASSCNLLAGCAGGYCGPFQIGSQYWIDGDYVVLRGDDPNRPFAFEACAVSYPCAQRIVSSYIAKFAKDCNGDGVTDCDDFAMINFNGGYGCHLSLNRNKSARMYKERYLNCTLSNKI